jgi:twinkle protein
MDHIESTTVRTHQPCGGCGSGDALSVYDDGHTYCFSCTETLREGTEIEHLDNYRKPQPDTPWSARRISTAVSEFYNVTVTDVAVMFPYHLPDGMRAAEKTRRTGKVFSTSGDFKNCTLFGTHTLGKALGTHSKTLIVTEGEADALAAFQMANSIQPSAKEISKRSNSIVHALSLKSGQASAERDFKNNLELLETFDRVFICFDSEPIAQEQAERCAKLLKPGKAFIVELEHKDACTYSSKGMEQEFLGHLKNTSCYTPSGIKNAASDFDGLWDEQNLRSIPFPFPGLQRKTLGVRSREIVTWAAGTGVGKSSLLRELQHFYLKQTDVSIGIIALEESVDRTRRGILAVEASDRLHLNEVFEKYSKEQIKEYFDNTLGSGRVFIYDHFGSLEMEDLINRVRYMVVGLDCKIIFIDHLSILVSGLDIHDERKAIDRTMTLLRQLTEETGCAIHLVTHLRRSGAERSHEEGLEVNLGHLRGSHGIAQISDTVVSMERDTQSDDPVECNTTTLRVLKCRYTGDTGACDKLLYDKSTGRLSTFKEEF